MTVEHCSQITENCFWTNLELDRSEAVSTYSCCIVFFFSSTHTHFSIIQFYRKNFFYFNDRCASNSKCKVQDFSQNLKRVEIEKCNQKWVCFARAAFTHVGTNEEHWNEFWLAQSCFVAKRNFTLYWLVRCGDQNKQTTPWMFSQDHLVLEAQEIRSFDKR